MSTTPSNHPHSLLDARSLNAVLDGMNVPTFVIDINHKIIFWNNALEAMTGVMEADVIGTHNQWQGFYTSARSTLADLVIDQITNVPKSLYGIVQPSKYVKNGFHSECWLEINGELRYVVFDAVPVIDENGKLVAAVETLQDMTEYKTTVSNLELSSRVINAMSEGVIVTDQDNHIIAVNDSFAKITGLHMLDVLGKTPEVLASVSSAPTISDILVNGPIVNDSWEGEVWNRHPDGVDYPCNAHINIIRDHKDEIINKVCVFNDVSKSKEYEDKIRELAHFDPLTGLPNRLLLSARIDSAIKNSIRSGKKFGVMLIDLDRFKYINDTMGFMFGDELLKTIGTRLQNSVRATDTVARLGGDEFVVVIVDALNENDISHVANNLIETISKPCHIGEHEITVYPSAGISIYPIDGEDTDKLMRNADTAMYHAKSNGGGGFQFFADQLNDKAFELMFLENSLKKAIENEEFRLYLQPQFNMATNKICGSEALLRWRHVDMGMMPPARFIPVAEEAGLIIPIGKWVMYEACRIAKILLDNGGVGLPVAVNISAVQMERTDLPALVNDCLLKYNLPASALELEVTESALMLDVERAVSILNDIGKMGVQIAIDDFGTGYSSLSRLKNFPLKKLKVDRSFVKDVEVDIHDAEICKAIISLAQNLKLHVVAEGVETKGQALFLHEAGCDVYQGYLLSPPVPEVDFYELIKTYEKD